MAKRCGFCDFTTEDDSTFPEHMRIAHGWGASIAAPTAPTAAPVAPAGTDPGVAKFCGNCGAVRDSLSTRFCRNCGASYDTSVAAARPASLAFAPKAGFWIRFGAYVIDVVVLSFIGFAVGLAVGVIGVAAKTPRDQLNAIANVIGALMSLSYFLYFWSRYGQGQTLGMRLRKLRVVRTDGSDLSIPRAFLRWIGFNLGILALFIGVISTGFDPHKQGWHDKLADTYVVRVG